MINSHIGNMEFSDLSIFHMLFHKIDAKQSYREQLRGNHSIATAMSTKNQRYTKNFMAIHIIVGEISRPKKLNIF